MPGFRRTSLVTALAAVLCITASTAEAIKFEMLDADGGVVGEYAPLATDWVTAPGSASGDVSALNGGGYRIDLDPGSFIVVDGTRFDLIQFHVHTPSEHTVAGELDHRRVDHRVEAPRIDSRAHELPLAPPAA